MDKVHKEYLTDVKARISGARVSQLAMAAPLIEAQVSFLCDHGGLVKRRNRVFHDSNQKVSYLRLCVDQPWKLRKDGYAWFQARARYGAAGVTYPPPRKPLLTLWAPTPPSTSTSDFVFFFPDWVEQVPMCSSLNDLEDVTEPLMKFIGIHISRDPLFLTKFLRLGRVHLQSTVTTLPPPPLLHNLIVA